MKGHLNAALAYIRSDSKPEDAKLEEIPLHLTFFGLGLCGCLASKNVNLFII
jgi:hypothetical protein